MTSNCASMFAILPSAAARRRSQVAAKASRKAAVRPEKWLKKVTRRRRCRPSTSDSWGSEAEDERTEEGTGLEGGGDMLKPGGVGALGRFF